jgi:hypothetical protein
MTDTGVLLDSTDAHHPCAGEGKTVHFYFNRKEWAPAATLLSGGMLCLSKGTEKIQGRATSHPGGAVEAGDTGGECEKQGVSTTAGSHRHLELPIHTEALPES